MTMCDKVQLRLESPFSLSCVDVFIEKGLKKFSNWPTFPQVYVNGELIGGLDILKEMVIFLRKHGMTDILMKRRFD